MLTTFVCYFLQVTLNMKSFEKFFCSICTVREKDAILPCGHTFCAPCLYQIKDVAVSDGLAPKCPVCCAPLTKIQPMFV